MKNTKKVLTLILALILILSVALPAFADTATATNMRITGIDGTITVKNASGKTVTARNDMKLYSGYTIATEKDSYVYISLDDTKAIKLDKSSNVSIKKNGKKLEVQVVSGSIFFNVTEPLKGDESLNIRTTTMVTGIRGTSGEASVMPADVRLDKNGRPESNMVWDESIMLFTGHAEIVATKSTGVDGARVSTNELEKGVEQGLEAGSEITAENRKEAKNELENIFNPKDTAATEVTVTDVDIYAGEAVVSRTIAVTETTQEYQVEKVAAVKEDISASALEEIIKDEDLQEKIAESTDLITDEEGKIDTEALENLVEEKKEEEEAAVKEKEEAYEEETAKIETETVQDQVFDPTVVADDYDDDDSYYEPPVPTSITLSGDSVTLQNYLDALNDSHLTEIIIDGGTITIGPNDNNADIPSDKTVILKNGAALNISSGAQVKVNGTLTVNADSTLNVENGGNLVILSTNSVHVSGTLNCAGHITIGDGPAQDNNNVGQAGLLEINSTGKLIYTSAEELEELEELYVGYGQLVIKGTADMGGRSVNISEASSLTLSSGSRIENVVNIFNSGSLSVFGTVAGSIVNSGSASVLSGGVANGVYCTSTGDLTVDGGNIYSTNTVDTTPYSLHLDGGKAVLKSGSILNANADGHVIILGGNTLPTVEMDENFIIRTKNSQDTLLENTKYIDDSEDGWYRLVKYDYSKLDDPSYQDLINSLQHVNAITITNLNKTEGKFTNSVGAGYAFTVPEDSTIEIKSGTLNNDISIPTRAKLVLSGVSAPVQIISYGTLNITDGVVGGNVTTPIILHNGSTTTISGGTVTGNTPITAYAGSTLNLNGGSIVAREGYGVQATRDLDTPDTKATVTINGSTISGPNGAVSAESSRVIIDSGNLSNTEDGQGGNGTLSCYDCVTTINGGTIINNNPNGRALFIMGSDTATTTISENAVIKTINAQDSSVPNGYKYVAAEEGWYVLKPITYYTVAVMDDDYFDSYLIMLNSEGSPITDTDGNPITIDKQSSYFVSSGNGLSNYKISEGSNIAVQVWPKEFVMIQNQPGEIPSLFTTTTYNTNLKTDMVERGQRVGYQFTISNLAYNFEVSYAYGERFDVDLASMKRVYDNAVTMASENTKIAKMYWDSSELAVENYTIPEGKTLIMGADSTLRFNGSSPLVNNGALELSCTLDNSYLGSDVFIQNNGTLNMNKSYSFYQKSLVNETNGIINLPENVYIRAYVSEYGSGDVSITNYGTINMASGAYITVQGDITSDKSAIFNMLGGTINASDQAFSLQNAEFNMSGGVINADGIAFAGYKNPSKITINGGEIYANTLVNNENAILTIGGTSVIKCAVSAEEEFDEPVYFLNANIITLNGDSWTVKSKNNSLLLNGIVNEQYSAKWSEVTDGDGWYNLLVQ